LGENEVATATAAPSTIATLGGGRDQPRRWREAALALAVYLLGTALYLMPFVGDPRGTLGPDFGDPRLNLYLLQWGARQIALGLPDLWNAPFFHPTPGALAISDHLIGPAFQALLLERIGVGPATAYNVLFLSSFALGGLTTWWLLRRAGLGFLGALLGGWLFAFAHSRWDEASHIQILLSQWIPAALLTWDRLLDSPRAGRATLFLLFYGLQSTSGVYLAVILHLGLAVMTLARWRDLRRPLASRGGRLVLAGTLAAGAAVSVPLALPYLARPPELQAAEPLSELRRYGATLASYVSPHRYTRTRDLGLPFPVSERGALFLGFGATALAVVGAFALRTERSRGFEARRRPSTALALGGAAAVAAALVAADYATSHTKHADSWARDRYLFAAALCAVGLWLLRLALRRRTLDRAPEPGAALRGRLLALGATGILLTFPFAIATLQEIAPPLRALRVSHRCFVLVLPAIGWLAGRGFEVLVARLPRRSARVLAATGIFALVTFELAPRLPPWHPIADEPAEMPLYAGFLRDAPAGTAVIEIPFRPGWRETERMLVQTAHWKPLANGYSSVIASSYSRIGELFDPMPDEAGLARLRELGFSHVVFHPGEERPGVRRATLRWLASRAAAGEVCLAFESDETLVIEISESVVEAP
jgi:hypothetical protein